MKRELIIKQLEEDSQEDLEQLNLTREEYEKLKQDWLNKETENFELVCQIELRKQIMQDLINNF
ncbi:MAG: hypothetical protein AABY06_01780 [Nanoarchaeota archaeon]